MADWSVPRKVRKSNFSTDEVDVLVDSVKSHYGILYGKYAKRATNRWIRQKAWLDILKRVNGVSIEKRTLQEVKNKWKKCQYALKEKVSRGSLADDPEETSWEDVGRFLTVSDAKAPGLFTMTFEGHWFWNDRTVTDDVAGDLNEDLVCLYR